MTLLLRQISTLRGAFIAVILTCFTAALTAENSRMTVSFAFNDQHNKSMVLKPEYEKPMIVAVTDKDGYQQMIEWIEPLTREFGDAVDFFPIADLRQVPGPLKGLIRRRFRKEFDYSVAMDWKGIAVERLSSKPEIANLYLLDQKGNVVETVGGSASGQNLSTMVKAIRAEFDARNASRMELSSKTESK